MTARAEFDPITANTITFIRSERHRLGWSAAHLSDVCDAYGAAHEPPILNTLSRTRIAKLEAGNAASVRIDEAYLLAGAFGISLDVLLTGAPNATELVPGEVDATRVTPHGPIGDRVRILEHQMAGLLEVLGEMGVRGLPEISGIEP